MFLQNFEISFILSLARIAQMPLGLFGSPPSFPPIHITSSLEHTHLEIWLFGSVPSPGGLALADFCQQGYFFLL